MNKPPPPLILASTSPFRRNLLTGLNLKFQTCKPKIDESIRDGEPAEILAERLSVTKARAAREHFSHGLVIGSDQVCVIDDEIYGKPGNHDNAMKQLQHASGRSMRFLTGLCLYDIERDRHQSLVEPFEVVLRKLTDQQIDYYLETEQPYQCAGSFKSEGLGIALFETLRGNDPSSLIGLPLIQLVRLLGNQGVDVLAAKSDMVSR